MVDVVTAQEKQCVDSWTALGTKAGQVVPVAVMQTIEALEDVW